MIKRDVGVIHLTDDIYYEYVTRIKDFGFEEYLILYPSKLNGEKILEDNKQNMLKVIREYIHESEMYGKCMDRSKKFYFDSQKESIINEAHDHQRKADMIAEKMNDGISPYAWYYSDGIIGYIDGNRISCDYVIYLDDK